MQETMQSVKETTELRQWFVMRDLKRGNAKQPAYKLLGELKIRGQRKNLRDLLFRHKF